MPINNNERKFGLDNKDEDESDEDEDMEIMEE